MKKVTKPKITFVMPVRNCVAFVSQTLRSLINQSLKDIEVICFDDASTDGTYDILKFYESQDDRIKTYQITKWAGGAWCRNEGNTCAEADIICVADAGDIYHTNKAKITYDYFRKHKDVDLLYHSVNVSNVQRNKQESQIALDYDFMKYPRGICHPTVAYKKEVVLRHPYRTDSLHTDQYEALFIALKLAGYKFAHIDNILLTKIDLSHLNTSRDMVAASKQKIKLYEEFGIPVENWLRRRANESDISE